MTEYDDIFISESNEQLDIAEKALLHFESESSLEYIDEAFRALHTFKGAANIFELTELGTFAHQIESILSEIKNNNIDSGGHLIEKILLYLDHLRQVLKDIELTDKALRKRHQQLKEELQAISDDINSRTELVKSDTHSSVLNDTGKNVLCTFYISISPIHKISRESSHPIFNIIEEIEQLGEVHVLPQYTIEPTSQKEVYKTWNIYISFNGTYQDLDTMFLFVEDEFEIVLQKVADTNLLASNDFLEEIKRISELDPDKQLKEIQVYIEEINKEENLLNEKSDVGYAEKSNSIRVSSNKIDRLMDLVSELLTNQASLVLHNKQHSDPKLKNLIDKSDRLLTSLRDISFEMGLVPIEAMMGRLKRLVRNSAKALGKDVEFIVSGSDTELDKSYIELLSDPFMHILRNSIDHGIENSEIRKAAGKPKKGKIELGAYYSGTDVHIKIKDDGKGLDKDAILTKAISKGIVEPEVTLSSKEILELIFVPGFSTSETVTDVSGRGVGMDVVRKNITSLNGSIELFSEKGEGTTILIKVPLTLSIVKGFLLRVGHTCFILPILSMQKCFSVPYHILTKSFDNTLVLDDEKMPIINIREELSMHESPEPEFVDVITIKTHGRVIGIAIDEIIDEYQAVVKSKSSHYRNQEYLSGASILGDGTVALVLDIDKLIEPKIHAVRI